MIPIYIKQVGASAAGKQVVRVECARCHCEYYYELARTGVGTGAALYGIGQDAARARAAEASRANLSQRLAQEAELVPCPKCHWINDQLVEGYRRTLYRGVAAAAAIVVIVGAALSGVVALAMRNGPQTDLWLIPYILTIGPLGSIAFAAFLFGLQRWMRAHIQPNRHYPLPPKVPPGTPPALVADEVSGVLLAATAKEVDARETTGEVEIQLGRHEFPKECCLCLKAADPAQGIPLFVTRDIQLTFPRCAACAATVKKTSRRIGQTFLVIILLVGIGLYLRWGFSQAEFWICAIITLLVAYVGSSMFAPRQETPAEVDVVDAARGILRIRFRNAAFASRIQNAE